MPTEPGVLAVGNFDSNVGYAWRLMEGLWCELSSVMRPKGHSMRVCFPSISTVPSCLTENGFEVDELDFSQRSSVAVFSQIKYLKRHSIKVLYLTDFPTANFRYVLYRMVGVKRIIIHDHTPGVRTPPGKIKRLLKSLINRLPLYSSSACFAVSPYVEERLHKVNCVPKSKIFCVTNGIDPLINYRALEKQQHLVEIVTVARASYYKGIDFALRTLAKLINEEGIYNFRYTLYGDGPDLAAFRKLSETLQLQEIVTFAGSVSNIPERLQNCDIAFHPSKGEAMSLAILEYMRAGLTVVASDNPSVSSALVHDEYALIYREEDTSSAAQTLKLAIQYPEVRERIGLAAREKVENEFSSVAMFKRFRAALEEVIAP